MKEHTKNLAPVICFLDIKLASLDKQLKTIYSNSPVSLDDRLKITSINLQKGRLLSFYNARRNVVIAGSCSPRITRSR
jgi:hypothetical protein